MGLSARCHNGRDVHSGVPISLNVLEPVGGSGLFVYRQEHFRDGYVAVNTGLQDGQVLLGQYASVELGLDAGSLARDITRIKQQR